MRHVEADPGNQNQICWKFLKFLYKLKLNGSGSQGNAKISIQNFHQKLNNLTLQVVSNFQPLEEEDKLNLSEERINVFYGFLRTS